MLIYHERDRYLIRHYISLIYFFELKIKLNIMPCTATFLFCPIEMVPLSDIGNFSKIPYRYLY